MWVRMKKDLVVTSPDNKKLKALKKLTSGEGIKKEGRTLVAGSRLVLETARFFPELCRFLIIHDGCAEESADMGSLIEQFESKEALLILKKGLFNELDTFQTGGPLLEIACPAIPPWDSALKEKGCTLLIPFQDPANVGAVVRSAAAFGVRHIVLLQEAANPFHPKSIRASGGAVFKVLFFRGPSLFEIGASPPCLLSSIVSLDMSGSPIQNFSFPQSFLLLPGMEGRGLPSALRQNAVSIPISSAVESLNAAVAASIALFYWQSCSAIKHIKPGK